MKFRIASISPIAVLLFISFAFPAFGQENKKSRATQETRSDSIYSELAKAPEKARVKRNPLEKDPDAASAGRILFEQHCAECHGNTAEGSKKAPSLRAAEVQNAEPGAIFWILTNGIVRKGMPVWSKLPEPQRWQLVSYIKLLGAGMAKPEPPAPAKPDPPKTKGESSPRR